MPDAPVAPAPAGAAATGAQTPAAKPPNGSNGTPAPAKAAAPAVAPGVTETPKPVDPFKPFKTRITYKGKEEEVDFSDEATAQRLAQRARLSDESSKRATAAEKRLKDILDAAGKSRGEFLKAIGVDEAAWGQEWAQEQLRRQGLSEEARAAEDHKRDAEGVKAENTRLKAQLQSHLQQQEKNQKWAKAEPQWAEALKKRGRIGDLGYIDIVSSIGDKLEAHGIDATPEQIAMEADEQWQSMVGKHLDNTPVERILQSLGPKLTPAVLWAALPDDGAKRAVMDLGLAWHKETRASKMSGTPPPPPAPAAPKEKGYLTPAEWKAGKRL